MSQKPPTDETSTTELKKNIDQSMQEHQVPKGNEQTEQETQDIDGGHVDSSDRQEQKATSEPSQKDISQDDMDLQKSLLLGIQESLEALFDLGDVQTNFSSPPKTPMVEVVEGGRQDDEPIIESEKPKLHVAPLDMDLEEESSEQKTEDQKEHSNADMSWEDMISSSIEKHIGNVFQGDNIEVKVIHSDHIVNVSSLQDVLSDLNDISLNDDVGNPQPHLQEVLSFEEKKREMQKDDESDFQVNQPDKTQTENKDLNKDLIQNIVPKGNIRIEMSEQQMIYVGLKPRNYRIFCEEGSLEVSIFEKAEYRDTDDIKKEITVLHVGQSMDIEHFHIVVLGKSVCNTGVYFIL